MASEAAQGSKAKLLDAAVRVFRKKGYAGTRVEDICEEAGLTKGSFFHHFKSKEEVAIAAADLFSDRADAFFADADYHRVSDPADRLIAYADFRKRHAAGALADFTCLLGMLTQETYETHPSIRDAAGKHILEHAAAIAKDAAEAKALHAPEARWTPESLGIFTQAVIQGAFILAKSKGDEGIAQDCLEHLQRYLALLFNRPFTEEEETR
ncbi:TetR/AcrR family transcriptional regulator [Rhodoligotrophos defluvii]|uniref:TetR/AcrR family transcriptional regulator n=1 Tax=Rhodoligotrophos defluvii TaxID=2561934 RepID=UPI0010C95B68|nr:TetR/AcrR family transcriptional regulator [Rhodoligotrophos defluvii]